MKGKQQSLWRVLAMREMRKQETLPIAASDKAASPQSWRHLAKPLAGCCRRRRRGIVRRPVAKLEEARGRNWEGYSGRGNCYQLLES